MSVYVYTRLESNRTVPDLSQLSSRHISISVVPSESAVKMLIKHNQVCAAVSQDVCINVFLIKKCMSATRTSCDDEV